MPARGRTHYDTLGLAPSASAAEIRSAWRRIVLQHHPDRSGSADSRRIFMAAKEAYEVLSGTDSRQAYDRSLAVRARAQAVFDRPAEPAVRIPDPTSEAARAAARSSRTQTHHATSVTEDLSRLSVAFARGQTAVAERISADIIARDPRQAMPYAVLGDIARAKGDRNEAQRLYAYAAQFAPSNREYQRRYEELLAESDVVWTRRGQQVQARPATVIPLFIGAVAAITLAVIAMMAEGTPGIFVTLALAFIAAAVMGFCLSAASWLDQFVSSFSSGSGRLSPTGLVIFAMVIQFWLGLVLSAILAGVQSSLSWSLVRFTVAMAGITLLFTVSVAVNQVFHWGDAALWTGNLATLGGIVGWNLGDIARQVRRAITR